MSRTASLAAAWLLIGCGSPPPIESVDPGRTSSEEPTLPDSNGPGAGPDTHERAAAPIPARAAGTPSTPATPADLGSDGATPVGAATAGPDSRAASSAKIATECTELCRGAEGTCSRKSVRECRANCGKYQSLADRCEVQVLSAIRCQATVPKLVCSNLASECVEQFRDLTACEHGLTPARVESALSPPPGWERVEDREGGFAIHLPPGATLGEYKGHRSWRARTSEQAELVVAMLPGLAGEATEKRMMESVMRYLGHECQPAVRLHGRFETERDVAERFDAKCEGGQIWHGMLRASRERLILIAEVVTREAQRVGDAYYYGFEYLE